MFAVLGEVKRTPCNPGQPDFIADGKNPADFQGVPSFDPVHLLKKRFSKFCIHYNHQKGLLRDF